MPQPSYRFETVELSPEARLLRVDGRSVNCARLPFDLLHLLCVHQGVLLHRDWLIEQLWPDEQQVADESLTQVLFKLRAVLGPHADAIVTVRGIGIRLDAVASRIDAGPQAPDESPVDVEGQAVPDPAPDKTRPGVRATDRRRILLPAIGVLALLALLLWYMSSSLQTRPAPTSLVDDPTIGIDLRPEDLHASHKQTYAILRSALAADALGDRGRALALLRVAHDGDQQSPYPAVWLALLTAPLQRDSAGTDWLQQAETRARNFNDSLLSAYVGLARTVKASDRQSTRNQLRALLDLRPRSWMLRQILARQLLVEGDLAAALVESRRIRYGNLGTRRLEDALGDRAALGDVEAARKTLETMEIQESDAGVLSVGARIAYSAGDYADASALFEKSNEAAKGKNRLDLRIWNSIMLALLTADQGDFEHALAILDQVGYLYYEATGKWHMPIEVMLLRAQWQALQGDMATSRKSLLDAYSRAQTEEPALLNMIQIVALRLTREMAGGASSEPETRPHRGETRIIQARLAWLSGDRAGAGRLLDEALALDLGQTAQRSEAELLAHELGRAITVPRRPFDPPLPLTRWPAYFALRNLPGPGAESEPTNVPEP